MKELLAFFEPGSIVTTRFVHHREWIINSVLRLQLEEETIEVSLKKEYIECLITKGMEIEVRMFYDGNILFVQGKIIELGLDSPQKVKIKINSANKIKNLREEPRYDVNIMAMIKASEVEYDYISIVKDISASGIGVIGTQNFSTNAEVFINVFISENNPLKLKGVVVRKKSCGYNIEYGISTRPIDDKNRNILEQYIIDLETRNNESISQIKKLREKIASTN